MAETIQFDVYPYSVDKLAEVLSTKWVKMRATRRKRHFHYFSEYLGPATAGGLGAHTIVTEEPYHSQSFLDDYADYYARGFQDYPRRCRRVHFFRHSFTKADLLAALADPGANPLLWDSYLGYIVVKPLPARQIGATLLLSYPVTTINRRHYPVARHYEVNLLGKQLTLRTLIFQEQDNNVSACATTALWMAFHKTANLFQTPLPSPYSITAAARNLFNHHGRTFPSAGLDQAQIGEAIQAVGLVTELRNYRQAGEWDLPPGSTENEYMAKQLQGAKGFMYAYLRLGLPVLLFLLLDENPQQGHLVTVTGYRLTGVAAPPSDELSLTADAMDRLYAHDDQMGPYARYAFKDNGRLLTPWPADPNWETTSRWRTYRQASLYSLFVPLVSDIRITYEQICKQVASFELLLADAVPEEVDIVWDIYLAFGSAHKETLRQEGILTGALLQAVLTAALPKYVWIARATLDQVILLELVFDATDLHTGFYCLLINVFPALRESLTTALRMQSFLRRIRKASDFDARFLPLLQQDLGLKPNRQRAG
jgi:hypothetical protein